MTNLEKLKQVMTIASMPGNYGANEYMRGMANGLILAVAIMEDKEPVYLVTEEQAQSALADMQEMINRVTAK